MKLTYLSDLESSREVVHTLDGCNRILRHYSRSPNADELILLSSELVDIPFALKPIGIQNSFYWICSRTDCGPFWRGVAIAKYKILLAYDWIQIQIFRSLYASGMLVHPRGEEPQWKHVRLDWLLIITAIATYGITVCGVYWLLNDVYWQALWCFWVNFFGWLSIGQRRKHLVAVRDREMRESNIRGFFQLHRITPTEDEFARCMLGILEPNEVVSMHRAWQAVHRAESESTHPCLYYSNSCHMRCAVHPYHPSEGKCNAECPSFTPKDNQQKI
jgi:hypothetical protein